MVLFVILLQPPQDFYALLCIGLLDIDRLEAALKSRIFFDMFPVFIDSGRAYDLDFPSRKRRFQYVGRIQRALRPACSDQGMQLIDEKEDITVRRNFPDHGTDPLLKFAAELCPGNHPRQVEHDHTPVLHDFRDLTAGNAECQSLHDRRFSYARFSDQAGVILGPAAQDLHDAQDFRLSPYHGIEFPFRRHRRQVTAVLVEHRRRSAGTAAACHGFQESVIDIPGGLYD